ncbi:hypothetical protein THMIRHAS_13830 [Thiosulfatimonas sediminis]|uniref:Uncharacterized protein n=1 Tax=Thiosulfatimonas sediminis TaxID=2675054 RepID=A0A6F8PVL1_9GAMM|nr:hypothetical protein [Thiosulfatimonas sediminis]BBP46010.1 hypothetical protein THMIRHAS_13830 [Thiosulfatimonas sediminis]
MKAIFISTLLLINTFYIANASACPTEGLEIEQHIAKLSEAINL